MLAARSGATKATAVWSVAGAGVALMVVIGASSPLARPAGCVRHLAGHFFLLRFACYPGPQQIAQHFRKRPFLSLGFSASLGFQLCRQPKIDCLVVVFRFCHGPLSC